jgi:antitoxin component YwqK of YwqJK toxin-antitoxin module
MSRSLYLLGCLGLLLTGCSCCKKQQDNVVSQTYIHKYGYAVSKGEFEERKYPGQVTTVLKNGVTTKANYENGVLHGPSTHTHPNSKIVENYLLYNHGVLVKQTVYDLNGMPLREETQLSPTRYSSTKWYADGVRMCAEEYAGKELVEAQYFTRLNDIEARIDKGSGKRIVRDLQGVLMSREEFSEGYLTKRDTFYASGAPESVAFYARGVLNGEKKSFSETGEPVAIKEYIAGKLHGKTTFFKNGARSVEIHYLNDLKNGLEIHYLDGTVVSQELLWENGKKHGPSRYYVEGIAQVEYFYDGDAVSEDKWRELNQLDEMIGQISLENAW